ncbi:non-ribosomal peptide synthetase [Labedaea rhizosphaerae]|uniref:Amino acid adenylation domain-containing protein n=1 Tax=Labedaea rhizosphaerae TaxID=598644 RepID=A0A4R6S1U6_LABRH|nr:non-ribosomal peptide synthetase [Labedaea rhizosphaerae]TDP92957.1 amino acid adenylation domain-containing protein [Labedaea rhizosphaerae]
MTGALSHQQERLHLAESLNSGTSANNLGCVHWISGALDVPALTAAITELHRRHDILRTRYPSAAAHVVDPAAEPALPVQDLSALTDPAAEVRRLLDASVDEPFDLAAAAPIRWSLFLLGPDRYALTLVVHHIAFDAWSKLVLNDELAALYEGRPLDAVPVQYADYAARQRDRTEALDDWVARLAGAPAATRLPFDHQPYAGTGFDGRASEIPMDADVVRRAELLGRQEHCSLFMVLLAAFAGLLSRYDGRRDLVVGVPTAGRDEPELESLIGCFMDTVPFRLGFPEARTFRDLLAVVRDVTLDTHDLQAVALGRLIGAVRPEREAGREPLVQVVFQVRNTPYEPLCLAGLDITEEARNPTATGLDLSVSVVEGTGTGGTGGPVGVWQYKSELFEPGTIERLQQDFERIVEKAVSDPDAPLDTYLVPIAVTGPAAGQHAVTATGGPIEDMLLAIWTEVLDVDDITAEDDFFKLGGHSLTAGQVIARIGELTGIPTRGLMRDVLRHSVLADFAAVLTERLAEHGIEFPVGTRRESRIPLFDRDQPLPLSPAQKRLWFLDQFVTDSSSYFVPVVLRLQGTLDVPALRRALAGIVERHEVLRTSVVVHDDEPVGLIQPVSRFDLEVVDVEGDLADAIAAETFRPLDLAAGLPIRATLLRIADEDAVLCLTVHHMAFDGGSLDVLFDELAQLYRGATLPALAVQYADVVAHQLSLQDTPEFARKLDFWRDELTGTQAFELAPDLPRPAKRTGYGVLHPFAVPEDVTRRLEEIAGRHGVTLFMTVLAAWRTLMHRYTGQDEILLGTPAAERDSTESEALIGFFINMLVLRGDLGGDPSFGELLDRTRENTLEAYAHQDVPFDRLVEELAPDRDPSRTPFFQTVVKAGNATPRLPELPGLVVTQLSGPPIPAKYDLEVDVNRVADGMVGELTYDTGLYRPATIARLAGHFTTLLAAIAAAPDEPISRLPLSGQAEHEQVRALTARRPIAVPALALHELFEAQAQRTPDAVAVVHGARRITYAELDGWANAIATELLERGVGPDVVVGVLLDRAPEMVAGLLGVLKAGGAYLPIETESPAARVAAVLTDSRAPVCLVGERLADVVAAAGCRPLTPPAQCTGEAPEVVVRPDNLCAVYYTSGSTGAPKGVACTHGGWVNRMAWMQHQHPLQAGEAVLHKTTLTFDDAAVEIFWPLAVGATVALIDPGLHRDPQAIIEATIRHRAVHVQFVPSMLDLFLAGLPDATGFESLRSVLSSGEALRPELVRRFREVFGDRVVLDNTWGATEVSIDSTCRVCRAEDGTGDGGAVSVGVPIDNNEVLVLDERMAQLPIGVAGELCIAGIGLARGYLGDPRRTAEKFVPHPYLAGERVYRTGDWGRMGPDGALTFLTRRDDQVKIRGVRIELGEVEHALRAHPQVSAAAVIAWEAAPGDKRLAAYVVATCSVDELTRHAKQLLPGYAVPGSIALLPELPVHSNGKLNKRALPDPERRTEPEPVSCPPRTPTEAAVCEIWAAVLGLPAIGVDEDFFAAGGHSLLATRAIARLRQAFTPTLPLTLMFDHATPAGAAAAIEEVLFEEIAGLSDEQASRLLS